MKIEDQINNLIKIYTDGIIDKRRLCHELISIGNMELKKLHWDERLFEKEKRY